jgi:hypothetical protein
MNKEISKNNLQQFVVCYIFLDFTPEFGISDNKLWFYPVKLNCENAYDVMLAECEQYMQAIHKNRKYELYFVSEYCKDETKHLYKSDRCFEDELAASKTLLNILAGKYFKENSISLMDNSKNNDFLEFIKSFFKVSNVEKRIGETTDHIYIVYDDSLDFPQNSLDISNLLNFQIICENEEKQIVKYNTDCLNTYTILKIKKEMLRHFNN